MICAPTKPGSPPRSSISTRRTRRRRRALLALIKRRHVNSRLRHYRVNIAFVFHAIELGLTTVRYCKTAHMRADFLTKALPVGAFRANAALVYPDYEYAPL